MTYLEEKREKNTSVSTQDYTFIQVYFVSKDLTESDFSFFVNPIHGGYLFLTLSEYSFLILESLR